MSMRIDRVALRNMDPLKILTEKGLIPDREDHQEENEDEEKEKEEKSKIAEIWEKLTVPNEDSRPGPLRELLHIGPNLSDLATLLNRSDVQIMLANLIAEGEKSESSAEKREMSNRVKKNLKALNGKIDRENKVWFRNMPLNFRILAQIEHIKIPNIKKD